MAKLYYLRGALGETHLLQEHKQAIHELLSGSYASSDLEKLKSYEVFSFRTSQKARLLFSLREVLAENYLVILDYLPNHEYDKSRFLKKGVLKHYLEKHAEEHARSVEEGFIFESLEKEQHEAIVRARTVLDGEKLEFTALDYYQQKIIELNTNQQEAINISLPAVISGAAGSGKSCVSLSLLVSYLNAHPELESPLLYVSKSRSLVDTIAAIWREQPIAQKHPDGIHFRTYNDLLPTRDPIEVADANFFQDWYLEYKKHQKLIAKHRKQALPELDAASVYQEFRIACVYSKDVYLGLGERQSSLPKEQRPWLYEAYASYGIFLTKNGRVDPAFYHWESEQKFALIVVDEAQDLSHQQLVQLSHLTEERAIVYCLDSHQRLFDRRSVRPFLLEHFRIPERNHIELNTTYRCPVKVIAAANAVIALKHRLIGGIGDKLEATHITAAAQEKDLGHLYITEPEQLENHSWLLAQVGQPYCAIVTSEEFFVEATSRFKTPLVFTPEQIKGLEYPIIIAYKIYEPSLFRDAQERLVMLGEVKSSPQYRPKAGAQDERFGPALNKIYTAYTRAQKLLVLCEPRERNYDLLLTQLNDLADKEPPSQACLHLQEHLSDWEQQIHIQLDAGNNVIAQAIFTTILGKTIEDFQSFMIEYRQRDISPPLPVIASSSSSCTQTVASTAGRVPEPKPATPPKKKESKPSMKTSPTAPQVAEQSCAETTQILALAENFIEKRLAVVIKLYDKSIWLKSYSKPDDQKLILADLLREDVHRKTFISCLVRNIETLKKVPLEELLTYFRLKQDSAIHDQLKKLKKVKSNYENYEKEIKKLSVIMENPMHAAAYMGDCEQITLLCELGSNPNEVMANGASPACLAAQRRQVQILRLLYDLGADLERAGPSQPTPAYVAAELGYVDVLHLLHSLGVDLNIGIKNENEEEISPVLIATQNRQLGVLRELHKLKVDLNKTRTNGLGAILIATQNEDIEVLHELHILGADFKQTRHDGAGVVHYAAANKRIKALRFLHQIGVDLDLCTNDGSTPAFVAAKKGHAEILVLLHELNADLNKATFEGTTLAHVAAKGGYENVMRTLIDLGCKIDETDDLGFSPALLALAHRRLNLVELLSRAGVDFKEKLMLSKEIFKEVFSICPNEVKERAAYKIDSSLGEKVEFSLFEMAGIMGYSEIEEFLSSKDQVRKDSFFAARTTSHTAEIAEDHSRPKI